MLEVVALVTGCEAELGADRAGSWGEGLLGVDDSFALV